MRLFAEITWFSPTGLVIVGWILWAALWAILSFGNKSAAKVDVGIHRWLVRVPMAVAIWLMFFPQIRHSFLGQHLWPESLWIEIPGVALTLTGFAFSIWARVHLGTNWSSEVQVKVGHQLVRSGPYRLVRHPIYTGIFFAMVGSAVTVGEARFFVTAAVLFIYFYYKLGREERFMLTEFPEDYAAYCRRTKALIPFVL